ncbi:DNA polymerase III subunit delta' C-terminal domain-containing protein [Escherichia coli]
MLAALNHEQAPARLHWLATLLMDALKTPSWCCAGDQC